MSARPRVAIAGFQHESNSFAPFATPFEAFLTPGGWPALTCGDDIPGRFSDLNLPIAGFMAAAHDMDLAPICWASAEPAGPVSDEAFDRIATMICDGVEAAGTVDAVYLDLHGAMVTESLEDGEGALLRRLRKRLGGETPIVVSLDMHANITPEMVELADAIAIYRTYPHVDMRETGARAARLLRSRLARGRPLEKGFWRFPYLVPLSAQSTEDWPCIGLFSLLPSLENETVLSVDLGIGFPPADIAECGPAFVAYATDAAVLEPLMRKLARTAEAAETSFPDLLTPVAEAARIAVEFGRPGRPVVIAEPQDNPGAGATGDSADLLRALVAAGARDAVIGLLWDPDAALAAHQAGLGAELELVLGDRYTASGVRRPARFRVDALSDGRARCDGAVMQGHLVELGPTALLMVIDERAEVRVIVTTARTQCLDQEMMRVVGVDPAAQAIVGVKSTNHFRADFDPIAERIVMAETSGANPCRLSTVAYRRLRPGMRLGPRGPAFAPPRN